MIHRHAGSLCNIKFNDGMATQGAKASAGKRTDPEDPLSVLTYPCVFPQQPTPLSANIPGSAAIFMSISQPTSKRNQHDIEHRHCHNSGYFYSLLSPCFLHKEMREYSYKHCISILALINNLHMNWFAFNKCISTEKLYLERWLTLHRNLETIKGITTPN